MKEYIKTTPILKRPPVYSMYAAPTIPKATSNIRDQAMIKIRQYLSDVLPPK